ncbi:MAG: S8 family serine peptidase [Candidatus Sericytochromatia bacterium]|nr:S8 family serine peptidase [Candidatus Sericytochromatia bacterium]
MPRTRLRFPATALLGIVLTACGTEATPNPHPRFDPHAEDQVLEAQAARRVLVKLRSSSARAALARLMSERGLVEEPGWHDTLGKLGWKVLRPTGDKTARSALTALGEAPEVAEACLSTPMTRPVPVRAAGGPEIETSYNDPLAPRQWAVARIGLAKAHARTEGSPRTLLAILDTGIDPAHPDLRDDGGHSRVILGRDWLKKTDNPVDGDSHGTHAAGIAGATANNRQGIVGVAPRIHLLAEKVVSDYGYGDATSVSAGIVHAVDARAHVLSMSLGSPTLSPLLRDAIAYAQGKDVLVVAAMGNSGRNDILYPAAMPGVLAVGATDEQDRKASFSSFGTWISLVAPGQGILSLLPTFPNNSKETGYGQKSGTSMATPYAAGLAALVADTRRDWSAATVKAHLERTAIPVGLGFSAEYGHGRIDAGRAIDAAFAQR